MKILVKVAIFIGFFSCLAGLIRSGPVLAEELKFPIFSRENIKRVINGELQDILPLVDKNFLVYLDSCALYLKSINLPTDTTNYYY